MKSINEYLIDILRSTRLYEMAWDQSKCEDIVDSQFNNIIENLVLILYFRISGLHTLNINHWKEELETAIFNAYKFRIKKDNSEKRRERLVKRVFDGNDSKDYNEIYYKILPKIKKESETLWNNPSTYSHSQLRDWLDEAILASINQMDDIMEMIIKHDPDKIIDWIEKL